MSSRSTRVRALAALTCLVSLTAAAPAVAAKWWWSGRPAESHYGGYASVLPDGSVLAAGGDEQVERYDPVTGRWAAAASMKGRHREGMGVTLPDGRILMAAGEVYPNYFKSAEIYDPAARTWSDAGALNVGRSFGRAVVLADGRVLVVGGDGPRVEADGAEIWDPATNKWTRTGPVRRVRTDASVALLPDGRVLAAGGMDSDALSSAEIYSPATDAWSDAASMGEARADAPAAVLPDGRVLVAGGHGGPFRYDLRTYDNSAEIFDPQTGTWSPTGDLSVPHGDGSGMVTLKNGRPMIIGGVWTSFVDQGPPLIWKSIVEKSAEVFDPATGTWTSTLPMSVGRYGLLAVTMNDGSVLAMEGANHAERYAETAPPDPPIFFPTPTPTPTPAATATPGPIATVAATPTATPVAVAVPAPKPSVAAFVKVPKRLAASRTGRIGVKLTCKGATGCRDTLVLRLRKTRTVLASTSFSIGGGRTATISLKLSKATRGRLAHRVTAVGLELAGQKLAVKSAVRG